MSIIMLKQFITPYIWKSCSVSTILPFVPSVSKNLGIIISFLLLLPFHENSAFLTIVRKNAERAHNLRYLLNLLRIKTSFHCHRWIFTLSLWLQCRSSSKCSKFEQKRDSHLQLVYLWVGKQLPQVHSRSGDCSAGGIFVHVVWQRKERRHVLFHSSWQMNKLSPTKGRSWWVGQCPQMCTCKRLSLLIVGENSQFMPRNIVCQQNLFLLLFTNLFPCRDFSAGNQKVRTLNRFTLRVCLIKAPDAALNIICKNKNTF